MSSYVPPGWPPGVHPPATPEFEQSAVAWLLDVVPPDYLLHGVLKRHPVALAALARHHLAACVEGARNGYRSARSELGPHLPPTAIEAVLTVYRSEGSRLAAAARAADLVERALHGEEFVRQIGGARPTMRRARAETASAPRARPRTGSATQPSDPAAQPTGTATQPSDPAAQPTGTATQPTEPRTRAAKGGKARRLPAATDPSAAKPSRQANVKGGARSASAEGLSGSSRSPE